MMQYKSFKGRLLAGAATVVATAMVLAGCSGGATESVENPGSADSGELTKVTLGGVPVTDLGYIVVAQEEGFFEEAGLDVTIEYAGNSTALVPALLNGQYDVIWGGLLTGLQAVEQGFPVKVIAASSKSTGIEGHDLSAILTLEGSGIETAADMPGHSLAVLVAGGTHEIQNEVLFKKLGVDSSTVEYVELPIPNMIAALEAGQVDAVTIPEPYLTSALQQGGFHIVESTPTAWSPNVYTSGYYVTDDTLEERPEMVDSFLAALKQSYELSAEDPDVLRRSTATITDIDPDVLEEMAFPANEWEGQADALREYGEAMLSVDAIEGPETIENLIAPVMP